MINFNQFSTVEVKVALQGARKEVVYFEQLLAQYDLPRLDKVEIMGARDSWIKTVGDLNAHLNSKLCK